MLGIFLISTDTNKRAQDKVRLRLGVELIASHFNLWLKTQESTGLKIKENFLKGSPKKVAFKKDLKDYLLNLNLQKEIQVFTFNLEGEFLLSVGGPSSLEKNQFRFPRIKKFIKKGNNTETFKYNLISSPKLGQIKILPDYNLAILVLSKPLPYIFSPNGLLYNVFLSAIFILFLLPFFAIIASIISSTPLNNLIRVTQEITNGEHSFKNPIPNTNKKDEIGILAKNFDWMRESIYDKLIKLEKSNEEKTILLNDLKLLIIEKDRVAEKERLELSRLLHDDPLQILGLLKAGIRKGFQSKCFSFKETKSPNCWYEKEQRQLTTYLGQTEEKLRKIIQGLRNETLNELGLGPALEELIQNIKKRTGKQVELAQEIDTKSQWGQKVENNLYGLIQEALNNFIKHADTDHCLVSLSGNESLLKVNILDKGKGFDPQTKKEGHFGLFGMRSRAEDLGGNFTIDSKIGRGTRISLELLKESTSPPN